MGGSPAAPPIHVERPCQSPRRPVSADTAKEAAQAKSELTRHSARTAAEVAVDVVAKFMIEDLTEADRALLMGNAIDMAAERHSDLVGDLAEGPCRQISLTRGDHARRHLTVAAPAIFLCVPCAERPRAIGHWQRLPIMARRKPRHRSEDHSQRARGARRDSTRCQKNELDYILRRDCVPLHPPLLASSDRPWQGCN